jgi:hypothetical protein
MSNRSAKERCEIIDSEATLKVSLNQASLGNSRQGEKKHFGISKKQARSLRTSKSPFERYVNLPEKYRQARALVRDGSRKAKEEEYARDILIYEGLIPGVNGFDSRDTDPLVIEAKKRLLRNRGIDPLSYLNNGHPPNGKIPILN